jgi:hypothetical protein
MVNIRLSLIYGEYRNKYMVNIGTQGDCGRVSAAWETVSWPERRGEAEPKKPDTNLMYWA